MSECESGIKSQPQIVRVPTKGNPSNENTNNTVNFPSTNTCNSHPINKTEAQVLVSPQPLKIFVDNSTDWPPVIATLLVGIGSIMTTLLIGWLSAMNQRTQIRSSIAAFRHKWLEELRTVTAEFVTIMAKILNKSSNNSEFWKTPESDELYSQLIQQHAKISLMLDAKKEYAKDLDDLMTKATDAIKSGNYKEVNELINTLLEKTREILEIAWTDIKSDLQSQRWWGGKI